MKLSEYANKNNITYKTAWNHFKAGKIPNARQLPSGTVVIDEGETIKDELIASQREVIKKQDIIIKQLEEKIKGNKDA